MRLVLLTALCSASLASIAADVSFERDVRPIFKEHCLSCHNPDKKKADLDLSTFDATLAGGSGGSIVKAGVPDSSILYMSMSHHDEAEPMPPKKPKLSRDKIELVRKWILSGLIARHGGESQLREIEFDVSKGSSSRPAGPPPMPGVLPKISLPSWHRAPVVRAVAMSPWAPVAAVARNSRIDLFEIGERQRRIGSLSFAYGEVSELKFSRNGKLLLASGGRGANTGKVTVFDVSSGSIVVEVGDEQDSILTADISADHSMIAIGTTSKMVKVFDTKTGSMLHRISKHTDWVTSVAFGPSGSLLATADRNGGIHLWQAEVGAIVVSLSEHKQRVTDMAWRSDGRMLASGSDDGKIVIWNVDDGWPTRVIDAHKAEKRVNTSSRGIGVLSMDWTRQGLLATCGRDRCVRIWNAQGETVREFPRIDALPTSIGMSSETGEMVVGTYTGSLFLAAKDGQRLLPLEY